MTDVPNRRSGELDVAQRELTSLLAKCEAIDLAGLSASRRTLMTNRIAALRTALALVAEAAAEARHELN